MACEVLKTLENHKHATWNITHIPIFFFY